MKLTAHNLILASFIATVVIVTAFFVWAFANVASTAIHGNSTAPGTWTGQ